MEGSENSTSTFKDVKRESSLSKVVNNFKRYGRFLDRHIQTSFLMAFADIKHVGVKGFKLEQALKEIDGPLIEVGGPTDQSYFQTDIKNSGEKMYVSNITPGHPVYKTEDGQRKVEKYEGKVDFLADATRLPFKDESVGALFASCLPNDMESDFIPEAGRVLKNDGLFIFAGTSDEIIKQAENTGFQMVELLRMKSRRSEQERYDVVFRKVPPQVVEQQV